MKRKKEEKTTKKKYAKPLLRVVNIAPGIQTLGIGCKLINSGMSYDQPCVALVCAGTPGS
ncbi:MAG: hypothetical protein MUP71_11680 [Candidatus Aminicenantes bacterium]|nr:hypothetical protein [Candidatus Aminicenantes bacterium]